MPGKAPTDRVRMRQVADRGHYDKETIHTILDAGLVAHVGFLDGGRPFVVPMAYARFGEHLILHASRGSRIAKTLTGGAPVCVTVTLIDGLVVARAAMHHSMNYRSVVVLGQAEEIKDDDEKWAALQVLVEHLIPGHWEQARQPSEKEFAATTVLRIPLDEASAKVRTGPPGSYEDDAPVWAGVVPFTFAAGAPLAMPEQDASLAVPANLTAYRRPGAE